MYSVGWGYTLWGGALWGGVTHYGAELCGVGLHTMGRSIYTGMELYSVGWGYTMGRSYILCEVRWVTCLVNIMLTTLLCNDLRSLKDQEHFYFSQTSELGVYYACMCVRLLGTSGVYVCAVTSDIVYVCAPVW